MEIVDILYECLIKNNSWQTILKGLLVTIEISALSLLFGTIIGAVVCALRMSKSRLLYHLTSAYIAILRGTPVLLLLLLMYYVIYAKTSFRAPMIAVAAFSFNVSGHIAELMRSALSATDKMQAEAARTLGFSRSQAFRLITLPQAAKIAKPMLQSTIVNLIQWTSIVGYVTITDLTRVINNISARTMQPLVMIIVGMVLYLGMAYLVYGLFALGSSISALRSERRMR